MKAYIAGEITGDANYRKKFGCAKKCLKAEGFVVINPAELPEGMDPDDYMRICMAMIESADVVAFLPDYVLSKGGAVGMGVLPVCRETDNVSGTNVFLQKCGGVNRGEV